MKEDFIQNIQFDLFSVELVIGETATLLLAENYVTIREVFVDGAKVEPNEEKQIFLTSGGDDLWENVSGVLSPKNNLVYSFVNALEKPTYLVNVVANSFVADATYEDFPFKCEIAVTGVTSANNAEVTFSLTQATSGDLAPICVTDTNKVIIYAKSDLGSIVIPLIKVEVVL